MDDEFIDSRQHLMQQEVLPGTYRSELMYWLPPSRVKTIRKGNDPGGTRCCPISRSSRPAGSRGSRPNSYAIGR
jgi:hypothetical protein